MKKALGVFLAAAMGISMLAGCDPAQPAPGTSAPASQQGASASADTGDAPAQAGGILVIGEYILDTQLAAINPFLPDNTSRNLLDLLYERLVYFNPISGELEMELATEYTWDAEHTQLTFTMNPDAKWHDGQPVTAEDVAFTFEAMNKQDILDRFNLWSHIDSVAAVDNTVVFKLSEPYLSLPQYASEIYIVPKHIWESAADISQELNNAPIGSGPFKWKSYNTGTDIQLDANKDYWRGAPKVDGMVINLYNTAPNATLALLKGDIAATMGTIAMSSIPEFMTKPGAQMQVYAGLNNFVVSMNHENEMLADPAVRKAMSMAINQADLITKAEYNGVFPASPGWLPELFGDLQSAKAKDSHVYDPAAAMELLESAGYTKGGDGIYQKDGKRLSFTYHNASGAPAQQMEAGMIQQWLLNIGVEIIPRLATWPELTQLLQTGQYDLLQNGIKFPPDPYAALNTSFNSAMTAPVGTATTGTNYFRYRNEEVDTLLNQVAGETDAAKRKELYIQIQDILAEDAVFLPMYNVGGHVPHYEGIQFSGWIEDAPIFCTRGVIEIYKV